MINLHKKYKFQITSVLCKYLFCEMYSEMLNFNFNFKKQLLFVKMDELYKYLLVHNLF